MQSPGSDDGAAVMVIAACTRYAVRPVLLPLRQNLNTLLYRFLRFPTDDRIMIVGDRVGNHREGIVRHTRDPRHGLCRFDKTVGDDRGCGNPGFFGGNGIVQTARRAATSITDGGNDSVTLLHVGHHFVRSRTAGIGLFEA